MDGDEMAGMRGDILMLLSLVEGLEEKVSTLIADQAVIKNYLLTISTVMALPPPRFGE